MTVKFGLMGMLCAQGIGQAQVPDEALKQKAIGVATALGLDFDGSSRVLSNARSDTVMSGNMMVTFFKAGQVAGWSGRSNAVRLPAGRVPSQPREALVHAASYCRLFGYTLDESAYALDSTGDGVAECRWENGTIFVHLRDRPYGFRTIRGNSLNIELEASSGDLTSFGARQGYSYRVPKIACTLDQAARAAQAAFQSVEGQIDADSMAIINNLADLKTHHELVYERSRPGLTAGPIPYDQPGRPMRLRYDFVVHGHSALVDAETGDLCGGAVAKVGPGASRRGIPMPWVVGGGFLAVAASLGVWLRRR